MSPSAEASVPALFNPSQIEVGKPPTSRVVSWQDFDETIDRLFIKLRRRFGNPDLIAGMSRGGLPLALSLSHLWGDSPFVCLMKDHPCVLDVSKARCIYLVDDILATGKSLEWAIDHLVRRCQAAESSLVIVTWHHWPAHRDMHWHQLPLISDEMILPTEWVVYPWEKQNRLNL